MTHEHDIELDSEDDEQVNLSNGWNTRHVVKYWCPTCKKFLYDKGKWTLIKD